MILDKLTSSKGTTVNHSIWSVSSDNLVDIVTVKIGNVLDVDDYVNLKSSLVIVRADDKLCYETSVD